MNTSISLMTVTHNRPQSLIKAIDSIRKQTFKDFQYIIINSGSTDNTDAIIKQYTQGLNVKHLSISINDPIMAIDMAYWQSDGQYIIRLDDDDTLPPTSLEILYRSAHTDIVYGNYVEINETENTVIPTSLMESIACGVLIDRAAISKAGGMVSCDVGMFIEYDLYIRLLNSGASVHKINQVVYNYYRSSNSMTRNAPEKLCSINKLIQKWGEQWTRTIRTY